MHKSASSLKYFLILLMICQSACTPRIDQRGKQIDPEHLKNLKAGLSTKEDVLRIVGSPSSSDVFDDNNWLYFYKTTKTVSFLAPEVLEQEMIIVRFDPQGLVQEVRIQDGQGQVVKPVQQKTPILGQEKSPLKQIFSNFGRFSKKDKKE